MKNSYKHNDNTRIEMQTRKSILETSERERVKDANEEEERKTKRGRKAESTYVCCLGLKWMERHSFIPSGKKQNFQNESNEKTMSADVFKQKTLSYWNFESKGMNCRLG